MVRPMYHLKSTWGYTPTSALHRGAALTNLFFRIHKVRQKIANFLIPKGLHGSATHAAIEVASRAFFRVKIALFTAAKVGTYELSLAFMNYIIICVYELYELL